MARQNVNQKLAQLAACVTVACEVAIRIGTKNGTLGGEDENKLKAAQELSYQIVDGKDEEEFGRAVAAMYTYVPPPPEEEETTEQPAT